MCAPAPRSTSDVSPATPTTAGAGVVLDAVSMRSALEFARALVPTLAGEGLTSPCARDARALTLAQERFGAAAPAAIELALLSVDTLGAARASTLGLLETLADTLTP